MAKYENGILGPFRGLVGTVVGSTWRGMDVMKIRPKRSTVKPTQKRLEQQARFSFVAKFIAPLAKLFSVTFNDPGRAATGANNAFRYNYTNALRGSHPTFSFNYSKILISKGALYPAVAPAVEVNGESLRFTWTDNSGVAQANTTDKCIMVAHCPDVESAVYKIGGATREAGSDTIDVEKFIDMRVETWLAFISEDEKEVSISIYTGHVDI